MGTGVVSAEPSAALVEAVVSKCRSELGDDSEWLNPAGYPDGLALCVLDSIWSLGVNYDHHVVPVLRRYRAMRRALGADPNTDGTEELLAAADRCGGPDGFAQALGNHQRTSTRAGAPTKAASVVQAARALGTVNITTAAEFRKAVAADAKAVELIWRAVPGQVSSDIGWRYLQLLAGVDEVKPDRMIARFLTSCGAPALTTSDSSALVRAAAVRLGVTARVLDHAIWRYQRAQRA